MRLVLHTFHRGTRSVAFEIAAVPDADVKKPVSYILRPVSYILRSVPQVSLGDGSYALATSEHGRAVIVAKGHWHSVLKLAELSTDIFVINWCDKELQRLADWLKGEM